MPSSSSLLVERDAPGTVSLDVERCALGFLGFLLVVPPRGGRIVQQRDTRRYRERTYILEIYLGPTLAGSVLIAKRTKGNSRPTLPISGKMIAASGRKPTAAPSSPA